MQINKENTNKSKFDIYQIEIWYDSILKEKKKKIWYVSNAVVYLT